MPYPNYHLSGHPFRTDSRKEGIRIPNTKSFPESVTEMEGLGLRHLQDLIHMTIFLFGSRIGFSNWDCSLKQFSK